MKKYIFSGSLTNEMKDLLQAMPDFEPLDMLVSQLDRSSVKQMIEWKKEGFVRFAFIDSGAYSVHTGKAKTTQDEYIEYLNEIDKEDLVDVYAQLDRIPGRLKQPKSPEDYEVSAQESWDNFLYMRRKLDHPEKLMPVSHFGENIKYFRRMLEWRDDDNNPLEWAGLSPANDATVQERNVYLMNMFDEIKKSSNPNVKTHVYGFTSLDSMSKFPCETADSITHRLLAGYCKIITEHWGIISVSKRDRTSKAKSNWSFIDGADEFNLKKLEDEAASMNLTISQLQDSVAARVAFNIKSIQRLTKTKYKYHEDNLVRPRKLF